ncbi:MAG: RND family transporter, partial [Dehalococcoidia bacterium]|nr:RND family transporter [Dehalococcoidia bacterium]
LILAIVALTNVAALISLTRIAIDTDVTGFFSEGNEVYDEYVALTEKYNISESIAILVEDDSSLLTEENLQTAYELRTTAEALSGVREVQTYLPAEMRLGSVVRDIDSHLISQHQEEIEDYIRQQYEPAREFLASDESKGLMAITLEYDAEGAAVVDTLKSLLKKHQNVTLSLAGDSVIGDTLEWYLLRILFLLPPAAAAIILLVFYSMLRNRRLTLLSMLPAAFGALWTLGTIFAQGQAVNIVTAICPIFILVMGSADGLHYTTHLLEKMALHKDRYTLTLETMRMVLKPIVLTSITTMAGFGSLAWSSLEPIRQMGIYVPLGIGYACLLSVFFLPAVLTHIHLPSDHRAPENGVITFFVNLPRHKVAILVAVAILLGVSAFNLPNLKVVSDPLLYFKQASPIRTTFKTIEDSFGGALVIVGDIKAPEGLRTLRDANYAEDVLDMERDLERVPGILTATSLFDVVLEASGQIDYPESPSTVNLILQRIDDEDLEPWYALDGLRLVARTTDLTSEDVALLQQFVDEHPELRTLNGTPVLYNELNRLTVQSQVRSLCLALVLVFLMLAAVFRDGRAAFYALVPISITIVAVMGTLAATGYNLNMVTATLSAITVGVGVDYAIHLISGVQYFRGLGMTVMESTEAALASVSRPVLASAFGLSAGVSVMFLSPLHIHTEVATMIWVAMAISSFGALALIPLFYRNGRTPKSSTHEDISA